MLVPMLLASHPTKSPSGKRVSYAPRLYRCEELNNRLFEYTFRRRLGRGAFGQVFLAETSATSSNGGSRQGPRLVAVKVVPRTKLVKESTRALALAEATNLKRLSETGSLSFTQLRETFCDAHNLYIVTDYLSGGTLRDELTRQTRTGLPMTNDRIVLIMAQLVEALAQLRNLRIIHRDIKPDNVLLDACGNVVLTDFGLSRLFDMGPEDMGSREGEDRSNGSSWLSFVKLRCEKNKRNADRNITEDTIAESCLTDSGCGTLAYAAPEMHRFEQYSFPADIYSLGIVFHELLFNRVPRSPPSSSITASTPTWFLTVHSKALAIDPTALDLLTSLLAIVPSNRITLSALRAHPFFTGVHWPTLAAHAYILPASHAPPVPPLKLSRACSMNVGIFVDPIAVLEDGPDGPLEDAYNECVTREMACRPGDPRKWKRRAGRVIRGALGRVMSVWDTVIGNGGSVRRREWIRDVKCGSDERFVQEVRADAALKTLPSIHEPRDNIEVRVNVEQDNEYSVPSRSSSIIANVGHKSSPRITHPISRSIKSQTPVRPRLRRITERIYSRSSDSSIPFTCSCEAELCSTIAIYTVSNDFSYGSVSSTETGTTDKHAVRPRPTLPRLSTRALPLSSPDPESSSTSLASSHEARVASTLASEHVRPRHFPSTTPSSSPSPSPTHPKFSWDAESGTLGVPLCPSLAASTLSLTSSAGPVTPVRGNSFLPVLPVDPEAGRKSKAERLLIEDDVFRSGDVCV